MGKLYNITVNGTTYEVEVEEVGAVASAPKTVTVAKPVAAAAPKAAPKAAGGAGAVKVTAPMPGKILAVKAAAGAAVKKGDVIAVLEAMKMENDIVAPQDGTIASIDTSVGASVETGTVLATMN